jgi:hypothetical protein
MNDQLIKEFITQVQFESGMHAADLSIYTYVIPWFSQENKTLKNYLYE